MSLVGQQFGEFTILERIGQGGMGAVYKASQTSLDRLVALKTLQASLAEDAEYIGRFQQEAKAAAKLMHPNLVQVFSAGRTDGLHWFAMEYVEGESAKVRLQRQGRLDPVEAIAIVLHVATALEYGWNKAQLIHRDIKPDNIFLSSDGEVKLGDLGLAKSVGQTQELTMTGKTMGSPHYISPEQVESMKHVDFRADIYSLGCTLYHFLCGQTPYAGNSAVAIMMKHVHSAVPDLQETWPDCPPELAGAVKKMMLKSPEERPQSYGQVIAELLRVYDRLSGRKVSPAIAETPPQPAAGVPPRGGGEDERPSPSGVEDDRATKPVGVDDRRTEPGGQDRGPAKPIGMDDRATTPRDKSSHRPRPVGKDTHPTNPKFEQPPVIPSAKRQGVAPGGEQSKSDSKPKWQFQKYAAIWAVRLRRPSVQVALATVLVSLGLGFLVIQKHFSRAPIVATPKPLAPAPKPIKAATPEPEKLAKLTASAFTTPAPATPMAASPALVNSSRSALMAATPNPASPSPNTPAAVASAEVSKIELVTNSLGQKFAPMGDVEFCIWLTRVKDFEIFAKAKGLKSTKWGEPGFRQEPDHPVVNVTWNEAVAFCAWLTEKEHADGSLLSNMVYRLPTDLEWSKAVGLPEESGKTPEERDMDVPDVYPWGTQWPPPPGAGNYTGEETGSDVAIVGYNDGYAWTSPVGSFKPNKYGLYDMGGNVWQWCMDAWNNESKKGKVLRGASWYNGALKLSLLSSCRVHASPDSSTDNYGFRIVRAPAEIGAKSIGAFQAAPSPAPRKAHKSAPK